MQDQKHVSPLLLIKCVSSPHRTYKGCILKGQPIKDYFVSALEAHTDSVFFSYVFMFWGMHHIYAMLLPCHIPWWCRCLRGNPPARVTGQNQTLYTPDCCSPARYGQPDRGGRSSCRRGTSCPLRCHWACPQAGRKTARHHGPKKQWEWCEGVVHTRDIILYAWNKQHISMNTYPQIDVQSSILHVFRNDHGRFDWKDSNINILIFRSL